MRPTMWLVCVLFLLLANAAPSQPPAGAKKKDTPFVLDYRTRFDAGAPSSFLVKNLAPKIKRADLKSDATDADRAAFEQLLDAIEKLQVNGVLFAAVGELENGKLRLKGMPKLSHGGRLRLLDATKGKAIDGLVPAHPLHLAVEAAKQIPDPQLKALTLAEIAMTLCKEAPYSPNNFAQLAYARHLFEHALAESQLMPVTSFEQGREFSSTVEQLAYVVASSGETPLARQVIDNGFTRRAAEDRKFTEGTSHAENALRFLMDQHLSRGQLNEAAAIRRGFLFPSSIAEVSMSFARFAAKQNDMTQALKEVEELLKDEKTKLKAWHAISHGLRDGGQAKEAIAYLGKIRDALKEKADNPKQQESADWETTWLASMYAESKQYDDAILVLEPLKSENKYVMVIRESHLGEYYARKGEHKKAREHGMKARELHRGAEYSLTLIAQGLVDAKKYDESWKALEEIEDPHFRFNAILHLAKALDSEGRKEEARDYCRLCLKIVEKMPEEKSYGGRSVRASMYATLAEAHTAIDEAGARAWIAKEFAPQSQAWAWIGVGRAWNARLKWQW